MDVEGLVFTSFFGGWSCGKQGAELKWKMWITIGGWGFMDIWTAFPEIIHNLTVVNTHDVSATQINGDYKRRRLSARSISS